jgi:hypothetical protein
VLADTLKPEAIWGMPDASENTLESTAHQSRFNFKAAKEIDGHKLAGFIEADFWENQGSYSQHRVCVTLISALIA